MKKIYLLSLGCPRNMIDSEVLLGLLESRRFEIVENPEGADIAIVNTCGFIEDAKQESIDFILRLGELKKEGHIKKIIVAGCLSQRFPDELTKELDDVDGIFGTADFTSIPEMIDKMYAAEEKVKKVSKNPDFLYDQSYKRNILTPSHSIYVKVQEGCSNGCSYCVIPHLKGAGRSRTIESVLAEIKGFVDEHAVKELILIGQDTTSFGAEKNGDPKFAELLRKSSPVMAGGWIRFLYTHPLRFTDELIGVMADTDNICKYVDLPIQHINDRILKDMNRHVTKDEIIQLIAKIRDRVKGVVIRSSVIVGFPGETEEEFRELLDFLEEVRFERMGAFIYSREEGTVAAEFPGQIAGEVKRERLEEVMSLQREISSENNLKYIGQTLKTLIDGYSDDDQGQLVGRSYMDAPEVDGLIYVGGDNIKIGDFVDVKISGTMEYDLVGEAV